MALNLSDPLTGTIAGGIVLMIIGGTYHYIRTLVTLHITNQKLSNILSELDTLHKSYKAEIADIKTRHNKDIAYAVNYAIDTYSQRMDNFIEQSKTSTNSLSLPMALKSKNF